MAISDEQFNDVVRRLAEAERYIADRKVQQITLPLDEPSKKIIGISNTAGQYVNLGDETVVTISGGAITISLSYHSLETEGGAGTDDLDTIATTGILNGTLLVLRANSSARTVVVKDETGNLRLAGDFSMDNSEDTITLLKDGSVWRELSRSDNDA
jgi:hypothetical protein